jgi:RHS repeat-associated protein
MNNDEGTVRLTLDPGPSQIVLADIVQTLSGPGTTYQHQKTFTGLAAGAHVLRIAYLTGAPGSENNRTNFDAVRAYSAGKQHVFDDDNRLKQTTEGANNTIYQYDKNGSLTKKTLGTDNTLYAYDGARRLKDVSFNGTSQASFTYDGNGARTSKTTATGTTAYVNDTRALTQVLQETKGANTLTYVPGVLQHDSSLTGNAQWSYFHQDAQNNRALTDNAASVSKRWEYDPFGSIRMQTGTASSDFQYAGEQRDSETGLINLRARYYEPVLGRFVSRDVLSGRSGFPQSFNRYVYALNNPVRQLDPSGYGVGCCNPTEQEGPHGEVQEEEKEYSHDCDCWERKRDGATSPETAPAQSAATAPAAQAPRGQTSGSSGGGAANNENEDVEEEQPPPASAPTAPTAPEPETPPPAPTPVGPPIPLTPRPASPSSSSTTGPSTPGAAASGPASMSPPGQQDQRREVDNKSPDGELTISIPGVFRTLQENFMTGYLDINVTIPYRLASGLLPTGITFGTMISSRGLNPYAGGALTTGWGFSFTTSPSTPTPGWTAALQAVVPVTVRIEGVPLTKVVVPVAVQAGYSFGYPSGGGSGLFGEVGVGWPAPSGNITAFHVW